MEPATAPPVPWLSAWHLSTSSPSSRACTCTLGWLQWRCCCGVGTSLQRGGNIWGLGHVTALQHDLLKPFLQSPEVLLFGWILMSFLTAGSMLHVQNFHSYRGRLPVGGLGGEESFAWKAASILCSASTALASSVLLQQSLGTVYKLQKNLRLLRISTRSLSSLIFHKS